jgi:hypothetical protein
LVSLDELARMALALPEVGEVTRYGNRSWAVAGNVFAWERPFSKADIRRFGAETPPAGPIAAFRVADLAEKEAVLATASDAVFTIPHFDGYAAVLVELDRISLTELNEALVDGYLACAPPDLSRAFLLKINGRSRSRD